MMMTQHVPQFCKQAEEESDIATFLLSFQTHTENFLTSSGKWASPMAGHLGRKTLQCLLECFFWPGFYEEVATLCRTCPECQKVAK